MAVGVGSGRFVAVGKVSVDFFVGVDATARLVLPGEVGLISRLVVNSVTQLLRKMINNTRVNREKHILVHFRLFITFVIQNNEKY